MVVKTFRGLLEDGGQDRIRLSTMKGKVGYKIVKFQLLPNTPGTGSDTEGVVQVFKTSQTSITGTVDFTDSDLLGAAYYEDAQNLSANSSIKIIFDNEIFNQDIFVSYKLLSGSQKINYYIELEVIPLTDQGAEFTTLKDLRAQS